MKMKYITQGLALLVLTVFFSSCLKDDRYVDFGASGTIVEFPLGGKINFAADAITETPDPSDNSTIVREFAVNVASPELPTKETKLTLAVDNSIVADYNKSQSVVSYEAFPTDAFKFTNTSVSIAAGKRVAIVSVTFYKAKLDPSKSYMLPIKIADAGGLNISANKGIHYYHIIGNDFAGTYIYDYRRYQNGTGPGPGKIPSKGEGLPPDITNDPNTKVAISPITPTSFSMVTNYNGQNVAYTVSFTRTVDGSIVRYTDWQVTFDDDNLKKWADAGITNKVAPAFTLPPPATSTDPKFFELNYVSGGASGRYIDDTYHK
ncbi:DUF1735 domain-containing protein [Mucilaginibacter celer]|uniref:DUF1735 domain-containing protein n=1 Tax=Mucilaginibacter celer TaxID=2305508 RepID=A0A494VS22_9SPHI|nr:DUF1735 domain-containing protein [Mucilaginibacter celer]AYL98407.1 DUF1735 domain-containing protein [Mucilaginibacter celer]